MFKNAFVCVCAKENAKWIKVFWSETSLWETLYSKKLLGDLRKSEKISSIKKLTYTTEGYSIDVMLYHIICMLTTQVKNKQHIANTKTKKSGYAQYQ